MGRAAQNDKAFIVKNTFIDFSSQDGSAGSGRRSSSCPRAVGADDVERTAAGGQRCRAADTVLAAAPAAPPKPPSAAPSGSGTGCFEVRASAFLPEGFYVTVRNTFVEIRDDASDEAASRGPLRPRSASVGAEPRSGSAAGVACARGAGAGSAGAGAGGIAEAPRAAPRSYAAVAAAGCKMREATKEAGAKQQPTRQQRPRLTPSTSASPATSGGTPGKLSPASGASPRAPEPEPVAAAQRRAGTGAAAMSASCASGPASVLRGAGGPRSTPPSTPPTAAADDSDSDSDSDDDSDSEQSDLEEMALCLRALLAEHTRKAKAAVSGAVTAPAAALRGGSGSGAVFGGGRGQQPRSGMSGMPRPERCR